MAAAHASPLDTRLYRAALRLCPGEFRRDHRDEMVCDFEEARDEAAAAGARELGRLRLLMGLDLARTLTVQWLRTGLPAIGCVAAGVSLVLIVSVASAGRWLSERLATDRETSEGVGFVLLAVLALMVIVSTIVFNLWAHRARLARRK
jgi:hypothetical protein